MGIVYRAEDERDGRIVALKVIRDAETSPDGSSPHVAEARERFVREAEILRNLLHVNIVSFYEIGEDDGTPFLAMEFLDGVPITNLAGRPYAETLPLLIQAANGLEYLASRGIVHRDLSPDNIFVVESGGERIVKLLDFGIAKLFETATGGLPGSLTATGFFLGKVAYGSPEQLGSLGHGALLDWRSDVYSLGVIFYQVLSGRRPFEGKAPVEYIAAHLNVAAPPAAAPPEAPALPIELVRLVAQMLEKRREDRPKSYREIADRLLAVLRDAGRTRSSELRVPRGVEDGGEAVSGPTGETALVAPGLSPSRAQTIPAAEILRTRSTLARSAVVVILLASVAVLLIARTLDRPAVAPRLSANRGRNPGPPPAPSAAPTPPPALAATGGLRILATPFARVLSVTEAASGRRVPLDPGSQTPLFLPFLSGEYDVELQCVTCTGSAARSVKRRVVVPDGSVALLAERFRSVEELAESLK